MAGTRREFIGMGVGAAAAVGLGAAFWDDVFGAAGSGPAELDPGRTYSVAASEMLIADGRGVGTEVEAVA